MDRVLSGPFGTIGTVRALTFDFWNTLVVDHGAELGKLRRRAVLATLNDAGLEVEDEDLDRLLAAAGAVHSEAWQLGRPFEPRHAADHLVVALGVAAESHREKIIAAFLEAGAEAELELTPHAAEVVAELADAGIGLGIVCDVGLTGSPHLRAYLARVGLLGRFDAWAFSDEVGAFKPSPVIFRYVLAGLGIAASADVVHVGDLKRTDVNGARGAGMGTIRYRGAADDPDPGPEADIVIDDLRELLPIALGA